MGQELFNILYLIVYIVGALAAGVFVLVQIWINGRLMTLQSYVTVSMVPARHPDGSYWLYVKNVGKINLYLMKSEIGPNVVNLEKGRLISVGGDPFYMLPIPVAPNLLGQEMIVKLYLQDELRVKYLTAGGLVIDPQLQSGVPTPDAVPPMILVNQPPMIVPGSVRAWTYKTEKFEWNI